MITYRYASAFTDGNMKTFDIALDPETLAMQNPTPSHPGWSRLDAPCESGPLDMTPRESTEDSDGALESLFHVYLKE